MITQGSASGLPIAMLGLNFDNLTVEQALARLDRMIESGNPHYVVTANVDFTAKARNDLELHRILVNAHLVLCDGTPLVWASRLLGNPLPERVAGSDIVPRLIARAADRGYRLFFLGASPASARKACERIRAQHPAVNIVGCCSPPFSSLLEMDHEAISTQIRDASPHVLLVSFGCPKQEKWMAMHYRTLGVPVVIGVGATVDFLSGQVNRAPEWMRSSGLEWAYRLAQEPRRLYRRYAHDFWVFSWWFSAQWFFLRPRGRLGRQPRPLVVTSGSHNSLILAGDLVRGTLTHLSIANHTATPAILDLRQVRNIDSTGLGWLMHFQRAKLCSGFSLPLINPSPSVRTALRVLKLDRFFPVFDSIEAGAAFIRNLEKEQTTPFTIDSAENSCVARWRGEITSYNVGGVSSQIAGVLSNLGGSRCTFDLAGVRFLDSSGVRLLLKAKELAHQTNVDLAFAGLQPSILRLLEASEAEADFFPQLPRRRWSLRRARKMETGLANPDL